MKFVTKIAESWLASNERPKGTVVDTVVLHSTAGASLRSSFAYLLGLLRNGKSGDDASYHAGADRDGTRLKMVPLSKRAWHAGLCLLGCGRPSLDVNSYSVGFAFANLNDGSEPITQAQIESVIEWINEVKAQLPLKYLTTHYGIAYPRKHDPMPSALSMVQIAHIAQETGLTVVRGKR